jgi:hypothetical protein
VLQDNRPNVLEYESSNAMHGIGQHPEQFQQSRQPRQFQSKIYITGFSRKLFGGRQKGFYESDIIHKLEMKRLQDAKS